MKTSKIIELISSVFIISPIWYYLLYWLIKQNNPDRLIWFLFWIYVPVAILLSIISKVSESNE